jgi:hypothetical protein
LDNEIENRSGNDRRKDFDRRSPRSVVEEAAIGDIVKSHK